MNEIASKGDAVVWRSSLMKVLPALVSATVLSACGGGGGGNDAGDAGAEAQYTPLEKTEVTRRAPAARTRVDAFTSNGKGAGEPIRHSIAGDGQVLRVGFVEPAGCDGLAITHTPNGFGSGYRSGAEYVITLPQQEAVSESVHLQVDLTCTKHFDSVEIEVGSQS